MIIPKYSYTLPLTTQPEMIIPKYSYTLPLTTKPENDYP